MSEKKFTLLDLATENTKAYGEHVIQQRSLVDIRDALKPVARRIIWAMGPGKGNLNLKPGSPFVKCARVVGDTIGKYHPHGDTSIYEALVNMAQSNYFTNNLIEGQGNFGGWNDNAAAYRYTECRLSKIAWEAYLDPDYLEICKLEPNYDGQQEEPFVLPCKLPMILLNGTYGIAVGATGAIPPIHPDTIKKLISRWLSRKEVTAEYIFKHLKFNWFYGSDCVSSDDDIKRWIKSGSQSLHFCPDYVIDSAKRTITFTNVPPFFNWDSVVKKLSGENDRSKEKEKGKAKKFKYDFVATYDNFTDKTTVAEGRVSDIVVKLKSTVKEEDFDKKMQIIIDLFSNGFNCKTNVTYRNDAEAVDFQRYSIPAIFNAWMEYRVDLEVRMQKNKLKNINEAIARQDLLILVTDNLDLVIKTIRHSLAPKEDLMKKLKLDEAQAEYILSMEMRRISKLSQNEVLKTKKRLLGEKKEAKYNRDNPNPKVEKDLAKGLALISKSVTMKVPA